MNIIKWAPSTVAVLGAFWATTAAALLPSNFSAGEQASNVLRFSGATATDQQIEDITRLAAGGICGSSISIYRSVAAQGASRGVLCIGAGAGLAGLDIAFLKESEFGSASGSAFVTSTNPTMIDFLDVFNANFACGGGDNNTGTNDAGTFNPALGFNTPNTLAATGSLLAASEYTNCAPQAQFAAEAGISDVEAALLGTDGGQATPLVQSQILFGVPVSLNLYRALQISQGITALAECDTAAEQDTQNCVPTLSKAQIAGVYNGLINSWAELTDDGVSLPTAPGVTAPVNNNTYICRRGNTSGTQIGTRAYFLEQGCGGSDVFRAPTAGTGGDATTGSPYVNNSPAIVFASDSSGDVRNCLDNRDDLNQWAIGVLSTENSVTGSVNLAAGGTTTTGDIGGAGGDATETNCVNATGGAIECHSREFRFVRVNGFLPSIETAANGGYDFYTENLCYSRNGALGATEAIIYDRVCGVNGVSEATRLRGLNEGFDNQPWGDGGNMGIPLKGPNVANAAPVSQLAMEGNPVNTWTKSASGVVNNCSTSLPLGQTNPVGGLVGPTLPNDATP